MDLPLGLVRIRGLSYPFKVLSTTGDGTGMEIAGETVEVRGWPASEADPPTSLAVDGELHLLVVERVERPTTYADSGAVPAVSRGGPHHEPAGPTRPGKDRAVLPPMPGKVLEVRVREGERVSAGQVLVVLEAMKMRNEVVSPMGGTVKGLRAREGENARAGEPLLSVSPE